MEDNAPFWTGGGNSPWARSEALERGGQMLIDMIADYLGGIGCSHERGKTALSFVSLWGWHQSVSVLGAVGTDAGLGKFWTMMLLTTTILEPKEADERCWSRLNEANLRSPGLSTIAYSSEGVGAIRAQAIVCIPPVRLEGVAGESASQVWSVLKDQGRQANALRAWAEDKYGVGAALSPEHAEFIWSYSPTDPQPTRIRDDIRTAMRAIPTLWEGTTVRESGIGTMSAELPSRSGVARLLVESQGHGDSGRLDIRLIVPQHGSCHIDTGCRLVFTFNGADIMEVSRRTRLGAWVCTDQGELQHCTTIYGEPSSCDWPGKQLIDWETDRLHLVLGDGAATRERSTCHLVPPGEGSVCTLLDLGRRVVQGVLPPEQALQQVGAGSFVANDVLQLCHLGQSLSQQGDVRNACLMCTLALTAMHNSSSDRVEEPIRGEACATLANLMIGLGFDQSQEAGNVAKLLKEALEESVWASPGEQASVELQLASVLDNLAEDRELALKMAARAVEHARQESDGRLQGIAEHVLGRCRMHDMAGDRQAGMNQAIMCFRESAEILRQTGHGGEVELARCLLDLGISLQDTGADLDRAYMEAAEALEEARGIFAMSQRQDEWAAATGELARCLWGRHTPPDGQDRATALELLQSALKVQTPEADNDNHAANLSSLASMLTADSVMAPPRDVRRAIECFDEARRYWTMRSAPERWMRLGVDLGMACLCRTVRADSSILGHGIEVLRDVVTEKLLAASFPATYVDALIVWVQILATRGVLMHRSGDVEMGFQAVKVARGIVARLGSSGDVLQWKSRGVDSGWSIEQETVQELVERVDGAEKALFRARLDVGM